MPTQGEAVAYEEPTRRRPVGNEGAEMSACMQPTGGIRGADEAQTGDGVDVRARALVQRAQCRVVEHNIRGSVRDR